MPAAPHPAPTTLRNTHPRRNTSHLTSSNPALSTTRLTTIQLRWSGPRVRAGFMDEPLIGLANRPSSATVEPTAMAALWPMLRPPVAVCRMTLTRIAVSKVSMTKARQSPPGLLIG